MIRKLLLSLFFATAFLTSTAFAEESVYPYFPFTAPLIQSQNTSLQYDSVTGATPSGIEVSQEEADRAISFGMFRLTSYCTGHCCNGKWGNITELGGPIVPGRTIAVDKSVIPLGTWVYINIEGQGWQKFRAEDTGSGVNGKHIDVAVLRHNETFNPAYNMFAEVRIAI